MVIIFDLVIRYVDKFFLFGFKMFLNYCLKTFRNQNFSIPAEWAFLTCLKLFYIFNQKLRNLVDVLEYKISKSIRKYHFKSGP